MQGMDAEEAIACLRRPERNGIGGFDGRRLVRVSTVCAVEVWDWLG